MKTLNLKYFGVTILIFRNHVTSSERDHRTRRGHFPIGGQWWPCVYLSPLGLLRYIASKLHLSMLKAKSSLRMLRVTWQGVQNDHIFGIPKSILPIHYTTSMRLRWRLRAVCRWKFYTEACFLRPKRWLRWQGRKQEHSSLSSRRLEDEDKSSRTHYCIFLEFLISTFNKKKHVPDHKGFGLPDPLVTHCL